MAVSRATVPLVRLALVALAAWTVLLGAGIVLAIAPHAWAVDAERSLDAARSLVAGTFGEDRGYLYSPLAAALTVPATWLPTGVAIWGWLLVKLAIVVVVAWHEVPGGWRTDRAIVAAAAVAAVAFLPSLHDLVLGNVSIVVALAVAVVVWRRDDPWAGVLLGFVLATAPKPQLIPFLVWMLVFRPRTAAGAAATAIGATLVSLALLGLGPYEAWIATLRAPEYLDGRPEYGNLSLLTWPPLLAGPLAIMALVAAATAIRRGPWPGLVACLGLGLLIAPYTMAYAAVVLLAVARPLAVAAPRATLALAALSPILIVLLFPVWVGAVMMVALVVPLAHWAASPFPPTDWRLPVPARSSVGSSP